MKGEVVHVFLCESSVTCHVVCSAVKQAFVEAESFKLMELLVCIAASMQFF